MRYEASKRHRRQSLRLRAYDYSQEGAYFVTTCTQHRLCLFGEVVDSRMRLNDAGKMVKSSWLTLVESFPFLELDESVVIQGVQEQNWHSFPGKLWQRNYHDRIIRNEGELDRIRQYILENPARWESDENNPGRPRPVRVGQPGRRDRNQPDGNG